MHEESPFLINLSALANDKEPLTIDCGDDFFQSLADDEITAGTIRVTIRVAPPRGGVYTVSYHITGQVFTPCDRCNEPALLTLDTEDLRQVAAYAIHDGVDTELPVAGRGDVYDLGHDIFETIALARPLGYHHAPGQCNPATLSHISGTAENQQEE